MVNIWQVARAIIQGIKKGPVPKDTGPKISRYLMRLTMFLCLIHTVDSLPILNGLYHVLIDHT